MNVFSALFPPEPVVAELHEALRPVRAEHPRLRWVDPARWHVTVRFFGDVAPDPVAQLAGLERVRAPVLRLRGSGHFRQVLWIGVEGALADLGDAAQVPPDWHPHLTVARGRVLPHVGFDGREWTPTEVVLVAGRPVEGYTVLDRVPLSTSNG